MMDCSSASCFNNSIRVESKNGIIDYDGNNKSSCVSDLSDVSSVVSSDDSDNNLFEEEVNSSESSSSSSSPCTSGSSPAAAASAGPLQDMSSLLQELPFKRGLSKHYDGKSQSFTSLSNVRCLEDLAKPENPYNKKLKSCRSYGGGLMLQESRHGSSSSLSKKATSSRGSSSYCSSSLCVRRNQSTGGFLGSNRRTPPVPPPSHRSSSSSRSNFATQTPLFALGV